MGRQNIFSDGPWERKLGICANGTSWELNTVSGSTVMRLSDPIGKGRDPYLQTVQTLKTIEALPGQGRNERSGVAYASVR
jgi:hypothetical protein